MPRSHTSLERINQELSWLNEPPDPNRCGCRHLRCCVREGHKPGECSRLPTTTFWTFRREYFCSTCREYCFAGAKAPGFMQLRNWEDDTVMVMARALEGML